MRFLFTTVDSAGALYPQLALAARTAARGHEVRFLACRSQRSAIERAGFEVRTYTGAPDFDTTVAARAVPDWQGRAVDVLQLYCDDIWFGPADAVAEDVLAEAGRAATDAIVIDYFAYGAAAAAERLDLPTAILWHTTYNEVEQIDALGLPRINAVRRRLGLEPDPSVYGAYRRARRILSFTTEDFAGARSVPANLRYVGPQLPPGQDPRERPPVFQGDEDANVGVPTVLVSLGTSYQGQEGLLSRVVDALSGLGVRALVGTGPAVRHEGPAPSNVELSRWVEHGEVLPHCDLVVTHAGLGTVMAATAYGVPLLCLPIGRDQHRNAARVAELGYGTVVDDVGDVEVLRRAIQHTLDHREHFARTLAAAGARIPPAGSGADELETLTLAP